MSGKHNDDITPTKPDTMHDLRKKGVSIPSLKAFSLRDSCKSYTNVMTTPAATPPRTGWTPRAPSTPRQSPAAAQTPPPLPKQIALVMSTPRPRPSSARYQHTPPRVDAPHLTIDQITSSKRLHTPSYNTWYTKIKEEMETSKDMHRSASVGLEAVLAQLHAAQASDCASPKLTTAVSCMILAKLVKTCFTRYENLADKLLREMFSALFVDFPGNDIPEHYRGVLGGDDDLDVQYDTEVDAGVASSHRRGAKPAAADPLQELCDINFLELTSFRDQHNDAIERADEKETRANRLTYALRNTSSSINRALERWQRASVATVFKAWRNLAANQAQRDVQYIQYTQKVQALSKRRMAFLQWARYTVSHSRSKLMAMSYTTHRSLQQNVDEFRVVCDAKDHELSKFRTSRDRQSKRLEALEDSLRVEKAVAAQLRSEAADMESRMLSQQTLINTLLVKYENKVTQRACVRVPVPKPSATTLQDTLVTWINHVFHPVPTVTNLSRDLRHGDTFVLMQTSLTGRRPNFSTSTPTAENKVAAFLTLLRTDVFPPPPMYLLDDTVTPEMVCRGYEPAVISLCLAALHTFVWSNRRHVFSVEEHEMPLDTGDAASTSHDPVIISKRVEAVAESETKFRAWEAYSCTLIEKYVASVQHTTYEDPRESPVMHCGASFESFVVALRMTPQLQSDVEDKRAFKNNRLKLWRWCVVFCSVRRHNMFSGNASHGVWEVSEAGFMTMLEILGVLKTATMSRVKEIRSAFQHVVAQCPQPHAPCATKSSLLPISHTIQLALDIANNSPTPGSSALGRQSPAKSPPLQQQQPNNSPTKQQQQQQVMMFRDLVKSLPLPPVDVTCGYTSTLVPTVKCALAAEEEYLRALFDAMSVKDGTELYVPYEAAMRFIGEFKDVLKHSDILPFIESDDDASAAEFVFWNIMHTQDDQQAPGITWQSFHALVSVLGCASVATPWIPTAERITLFLKRLRM
eukprot:PhM_4_TR14163/c0_g1_i1/m.99576